MIAANIAGIVMSYSNLFEFAWSRAAMALWQALLFPLLIDTFLVTGELRLYIAHARREGVRVRAAGWALTGAGLGASLAGNIAHLGPSADLWQRLAAATPPLAAASSLAVVLGLVKWHARAPRRAAESVAGSADPARNAPAAKPARARLGGQRTSWQSWADSPAGQEWMAKIAAGDPITDRALAKELGSSRHSAAQLIRAARNGHG